jgi:hypothetical protein
MAVILVSPVIALIAALAFRAVARRKGYAARWIWLSPLAVAGLIALVVVALGWVVGRVLDGSGSPLLAIYPDLLGFLALILQLGWIGKAWKQIKALPPRPELERAPAAQAPRK